MARGKEGVLADLRAAKVDEAVVQTVSVSMDKNLPAKIYTAAVLFLGFATLILTVGAVAALLMDKTSSDALWTAVGAGLGALAGIFTARNA